MKISIETDKDVLPSHLIDLLADYKSKMDMIYGLANEWLLSGDGQGAEATQAMIEINRLSKPAEKK